MAFAATVYPALNEDGSSRSVPKHDGSGDVPAIGYTITNAVVYGDYYQPLLVSGDLLTADPLNGGTSPSVMGTARWVLSVDTDAILGASAGPWPWAQARTAGATVAGALDGDTWVWSAASMVAPGADVLAPNVLVAGRWIRDPSSGGGGTANEWWGVPLNEPAFTTAGTLTNNNVPYFDSTAGVWKTRPLPGDLPVFNLADFGAAGNGVTFDTAAVQAWIDACIDPVSRQARGIAYAPLASVFYRLNAQIRIQNVFGLRFMTPGAGLASFRFETAAGIHAFLLDGARNCHFDGIAAGGHFGAVVASVFRVIARSNPAYFETGDNVWTNCVIGTGGVHADYSFRFETGSGDNHVNYCDTHGYRQAAFYIQAAARMHSRAARFKGILFAGADGLRCDGGSFTIDAPAGGGGFHTAGGVDLVITSNDQPCTLTGWNSEGSQRFVTIGNPAAPSDLPSGPPVSIMGKRLTAGGNLHADGRCVRIYSGTPFVFENNMVESAGTPGALPPRIYLGTPSARALHLGANSWASQSGPNHTPVRVASGVGTYYQGCLEWDDTWTEPPTVSPAYQMSMIDGGGGAYQRYSFPARMNMRSFSRSTAVYGSNAFAVFTTPVTASDTFTVNWASMMIPAITEPDTNFELHVGTVRLLSGAPVGTLDCEIIAYTASTVTLKFNQGLTGLSAKVSMIVMRYL